MDSDTTTAHDPLLRFCFDLTLPREHLSGGPGLLWPVQPGMYAKETARTWAILARHHDPDARALRKKANPVWLDAGGVTGTHGTTGADGAERTAVLHGAVTAWIEGDMPPSLRGQRLLGLDYDAVMDGVDVQPLTEWSAAMRARYPHIYHFEELDSDPDLALTHQRHMQEREDWLRANGAYQRLLAVLSALRDTHVAGTPAILYVDHIHRLLGGGGEHYPFDLTLVLHPLLHRRQIQLWGACTLAEYRTTIEQDVAIERCFEVVRLPSSRTN
jgi:hypothetical protein